MPFEKADCCDMQIKLQQERGTLADANSGLLMDILSPVQSALLMLRAWPAHCDCLAFANFVQVCHHTACMSACCCMATPLGWCIGAL